MRPEDINMSNITSETVHVTCESLRDSNKYSKIFKNYIFPLLGLGSGPIQVLSYHSKISQCIFLLLFWIVTCLIQFLRVLVLCAI